MGFIVILSLLRVGPAQPENKLRKVLSGHYTAVVD
jgi:hypothetical protein